MNPCTRNTLTFLVRALAYVSQNLEWPQTLKVVSLYPWKKIAWTPSFMEAYSQFSLDVDFHLAPRASLFTHYKIGSFPTSGQPLFFFCKAKEEARIAKRKRIKPSIMSSNSNGISITKFHWKAWQMDQVFKMIEITTFNNTHLCADA